MSLGGLRVYGHSLERTGQVRTLVNERGPHHAQPLAHHGDMSRQIMFRFWLLPNSTRGPDQPISAVRLTS